MTHAVIRVERMGGSFTVTLPEDLVDALKLEEGDLVEVVVRRARGNYLGILQGIGPFTEEDRGDHPG